jgi:hypothetical protein
VPTAHPAATKEPATPKPSGRLAPEMIRAVVRSRYDTFRTCYESGLGRHPTLQGQVTFRFVIGLDGHVSNVVVTDNTLPDCAVVACVLEEMSSTTFPPPDGGIVTVQYPIILQPG